MDPRFARKFGVNVPLVSMEHQYMVTEPMGVPGNLPTLRDPDRLCYYKEEVGGLVMGGYEPNPIPWAVEGIPQGFHYTLLDSNFDHFEQIMEQALGRVPGLETAGIKTLTNGPESFHARRQFHHRRSAGTCGTSSSARVSTPLASPRAGARAWRWRNGRIRASRPLICGPPISAALAARISTPTGSAPARSKRMASITPWPGPTKSTIAAAPAANPRFDEVLKAQGACFGEKLGWERPNWFADASLGETPKDVYSFGRQNWFGAVGREHRAAREAAVLFDQTSFAKFALKGPDALAALNWICAANVDKPVGSLTYTQMLNDKGGIECDLTVGRVAQDEFYIVTGTGFATHDFNWISRNIPEGMNCQLFDVTSSNAVLSLMGPAARAILEQVTRDDVSNAGFPFATLRTIGIAGCPVLALRVTYVGELGWELHLPVEYAQTVYDALMRAGADHGLVNAGYRAIETLRLEKTYRAWGSDIGPDHTPVEAGLGWAVKLNRNIDFKGRAAVAAQKSDGVKKLLACFTVDADIVLLGRETIYRNGERVGWLSSGGYGHTIGKSIGLGYVRNPEGVTAEYVMSGSYELEVATERVPVRVHMTPLHDPEMARVKA